MQAQEGYRLCPGGICQAPNDGRQCPEGSLLSSKGQAGPEPLAEWPYGYTKSPAQYTGTTSLQDGLKVDVGAVDCDGGGVCEGTSTCMAPNTGKE